MSSSSNIKPGEMKEPKHRMRMAFAIVLSGIFMPVIVLGGAFAMCRAMFAVGVALTEELFKD